MSSDNSATNSQGSMSPIPDQIPYPIMVEEQLGFDVLGN
jgi:hypothetical protein